MNKAVITHVIRKSFAELAIGVSLCAAAYLLIVDPIAGKLAAANKQVDTLQNAITQLRATPSAVANSAQQAETAGRLLARIEERSLLAKEHTQMLQTIMNLAGNTGVKIDQFNPVTPRGPKPQTPAAVSPNGPAQASGPKFDPKLEFRSAYSITLKGSFGQCIAFVRSLQHDVGLTFMKSIVISPGSGDSADSVSITLESEHIGLNTAALKQASSLPGATEHRGPPDMRNQPMATAEKQP